MRLVVTAYDDDDGSREAEDSLVSWQPNRFQVNLSIYADPFPHAK